MNYLTTIFLLAPVPSSVLPTFEKFGRISFVVKILLLFQFARKAELLLRPDNIFCAEFSEWFFVQQRFVVSLSFLPCQMFISSAINSPPCYAFFAKWKIVECLIWIRLWQMRPFSNGAWKGASLLQWHKINFYNSVYLPLKWHLFL